MYAAISRELHEDWANGPKPASMSIRFISKAMWKSVPVQGIIYTLDEKPLKRRTTCKLTIIWKACQFILSCIQWSENCWKGKSSDDAIRLLRATHSRPQIQLTIIWKAFQFMFSCIQAAGTRNGVNSSSVGKWNLSQAAWVYSRCPFLFGLRNPVESSFCSLKQATFIAQGIQSCMVLVIPAAWFC